MDVVFSLQRSGSDAVFSYQFTVEVASAIADGGGLSTRRRYRPRNDEPAEVPAMPVAVVAIELPPAVVAVEPFDEEDDEMLLAATVLFMQ